MTRLTALWLAGGLLAGVTLAAPAMAAPESSEILAAKDANSTFVTVMDPWVREAPPGARVLGAYMTLVNPSGKADRLLSVTSPMAGEIEMHRMTVKNGMMDMEAVDFVTVPAKGEVKLQPGGLHLMIYGMKRELKEGDKLPMELKFEHAGTQKVDFPVRKFTGKSQHH